MASLRSPTRGCYSNYAYSAHWEGESRVRFPPAATSSRRRLSWQQREPPVGAPTAAWRGDDPRGMYLEDPRSRFAEDPGRPAAWSPDTRRRADALLSPRIPPRVPNHTRVSRPVQRRHSEAEARWYVNEEARTPRKTPTPQHEALPSPSRSLKASWITLPEPLQEQPTAALCVSGTMLVLAGLATCVAGFCFLAWDGRRYFLDVALVSGFAAFLLGAAGLRSRAWQWFPNRNYVSGYMLLAIFSVLTAAGLVTLLVYKPRPGTPLADMVGGAICGVSGLSLLLAGLGVVASQCCKYPPPDNRVQHCAEGFVI